MGRTFTSTQKDQRKQSRKGKSLKSQMVSEQIQARYANAVVQVLWFLADMNNSDLTWDNFDEAICSWVEMAYAEGEHKT